MLTLAAIRPSMMQLGALRVLTARVQMSEKGCQGVRGQGVSVREKGTFKKFYTLSDEKWLKS